MRPLNGLLLAGLMLLLPLCAAAEPVGYVAAFNRLYRLDLGTLQATSVGPIGFNDVDGLAFAPDGTLYGVADATAGSGGGISDLLIRINTSTGAGTLVGPLTGLSESVGLDYGLAFTCDGRLWLSSDTTGQFWEVTPSTGQVRFVSHSGAPMSGLAARGNELFGIGVRQGFGNIALQSTYRVDPGTGVATQIGSLGVNETLSGAGADFDASGQLWATLDSQPPDFNRATRVARIDLATGLATVTGSIAGIQDNVSARGLAIGPPTACMNGGGGGTVAIPQPFPIPGPGVPFLCVLALLCVAFAMRRMS